MRIGNPTKAGLAGLSLILLTVLLLTHSVDDAAALGLIGSIIGYVVGNGVGARHRINIDPILAPVEEKNQ